MLDLGSAIASTLAAVSLSVALMLASPVAAAAETDVAGGDGAELVFHPGLEADFARGVNELRAAYDLGPVEFRLSAGLPAEFLEFRDCYMPLQLDGLGHDWDRCLVTNAVDEYRGFWDILGRFEGPPHAGPSSTLLLWNDSPGHRRVLLGEADWMTVYVSCSSDGASSHRVVSIFFGADQGVPAANDVARLNVPRDHRDWSAWANRIDDGSHSCSNAPEPDIDAESPGVLYPIASETSANRAMPQTWGPFQIGRLYEAFFDRNPDADGWMFWRQQLAQGRKNLVEISEDFVFSEEFQRIYGDAVSDEEFVELVYLNVLDRASDSSGKLYWLERMSQGLTRGELMVHFSESIEFIAKTGPTLIPDCWDGDVVRSFGCAAG